MKSKERKKLEKLVDATAKKLWEEFYNKNGILVGTDVDNDKDIFIHISFKNTSFGFDIPKGKFWELTKGVICASEKLGFMER